MCQCPLFKQFTTNSTTRNVLGGVFIVCVNVLFLSNSQLYADTFMQRVSVYRMCQCPLFKQFTTKAISILSGFLVFIVCVNVLFLSNSQRAPVA